MKIFKLFANCIPVKGTVRSIICDLQRSDFVFIPEGLYEILTLYKNKSVDFIKQKYDKNNHELIDDYFQFLIEKEYGFWCDDVDRFPDIDLIFDSPELINNAIIDIGNKTSHDFNKIFSELNLLRCKFLEIRYFKVIKIENLLDDLLIHIYDKSFRNVIIYLKYYPEIVEDILKHDILTKYLVIGELIIHSSPYNKIINNKSYNLAILQKETLKSQDDCGKIGIENFSINIKTFSEAQCFNTCLNKKISVDSDGKIKNCPSFKQDYGNIIDTSLIDVSNRTAFQQIWKIDKSKIEVCKDCEFRYICTDCRAYVKNIFDQPLNCNYNPYEGKWK